MVEKLHFDVIVLGGGAAGLAAATKLRELGIDRVVVIDYHPYVDGLLGGILPQCIHPGFGVHYFREDLTGSEFAFKLIRRAEKIGVEILSDAYASKLRTTSRTIEVTALSRRGLMSISSRALIYAAGARERSIFEIGVAGERPSGVYTAGEAQAMMDLHGIMPGREVVVVGSGDVGLIMARRFALEGAVVKAVIELMPWPGGLTRNIVQCLRDYNIPLLLSHMVTRIIGKDRVRGIEVVRVDEGLRPIAGTHKIINCDTVIIAAGLIPRVELLEEAGAEIDGATGGPVVNDYLETSLHNVFAAGNSLIINDLVDYAAEQGEQAAISAHYVISGGEIPRDNVKRVTLGRNIRLAVPQLLTGAQDVIMYIRVKRPEENAKLVIPEIGDEIKFQRVRPAEIIRVKVKGDDIMRVHDDKITITLETN